VEHLQHFGLKQDPFQNEPDLRFYFDSASHREAQLRIERGLRQNKGLTVLSGDSGSGKTLITRRIFDGLEDEIFEVSLMVILPGAADAGSVLLRFARQLGVEDPSSDRSVLLGQMYEKLAIVREEGRNSLLILDDAHALESDAMAEIAGLSNLEYEDRRLLSMLWVGSPGIDEMLARDTGVGQRVEVRAVLNPLDQENSAAYVQHRIQTAGGSPEIVSADAMAALFKYGRGRPRLLNTLADNGLFEAYLAGRKQLAPEDVERAAGELGIGPDPGSTFSQLPQKELPDADSAAIMGQLTDPEAGATLAPEPVAASDDPFAGIGDADDPVDIGSLFESEGGDGEELTSLLSNDSPAAGVVDLDFEADPMAEATRIALPEEESASPSDDPLSLGGAEATRIAFADEEIPFAESAPPAPGAAAVTQPDGGDEIDDLFVELIDE